MALRDRLFGATPSIHRVQSLAMALILLGVAAALVALTLGRVPLAIRALGVALLSLGGIQLLVPETMVRASRLGDRLEKSPSDPVTEGEVLGKRLGGALLVALGLALALGAGVVANLLPVGG